MTPDEIVGPALALTGMALLLTGTINAMRRASPYADDPDPEPEPAPEPEPYVPPCPHNDLEDVYVHDRNGAPPEGDLVRRICKTCDADLPPTFKPFARKSWLDARQGPVLPCRECDYDEIQPTDMSHPILYVRTRACPQHIDVADIDTIGERPDTDGRCQQCTWVHGPPPLFTGAWFLAEQCDACRKRDGHKPGTTVTMPDGTVWRPGESTPAAT